jgi:hypothetical protein
MGMAQTRARHYSIQFTVMSEYFGVFLSDALAPSKFLVISSVSFPYAGLR